jgi:dinuclear metal center YbgI/SA1388 family protein
MKIAEVTRLIEEMAPLRLQEGWDNCGLQVGNADAEATGALLCLDVTEAILDEAIAKGLNLIVTHHPLIFKGLKSITGKNHIERIVMRAIKNDIAIYSAHTNMDSAWGGVSHLIAKKIGLTDVEVLCPQQEASVGLGVVGNLPCEEDALAFLSRVKKIFGAGAVRFGGKADITIGRVAICGGAGVEFVNNAVAHGADVYLTGDVKYHDFQGASERILIADIGHYESEYFTKEIFSEIITKKIPNFAVQYAELEKNPINYL